MCSNLMNYGRLCSKRPPNDVVIALCRCTSQIVAFVIGDRSDATCRRLWNKIPEGYLVCHSYSDLWASYQKFFSSETHQAVGKESGQTAHVERWNNTLRQRLARFVRKTLSFSTSDVYHNIVTKWFIANTTGLITYHLATIRSYN